MYLIDARELIDGDYNLTEADKILTLLAVTERGKFCSLDFFCKNILTNYRSLDQKFQRDRVRIMTKINHLFDQGKIAKEILPLDTSERIKFAKKVHGGIINDGPRKTISVFMLTPRGWADFKELRNRIQMLRMQNVWMFIREKNLFAENRRRAFFLLLSLAPNNKYVSKFFIRDKIEEAILRGLFPKDIFEQLGNNYLEDIRTDFYCLAAKGFIERVDMSQSSQSCFKLFCKSQVTGSYFLAPYRRTQIFQRLTCAGKKRLKKIMNGQA